MDQCFERSNVRGADARFEFILCYLGWMREEGKIGAHLRLRMISADDGLFVRGNVLKSLFVFDASSLSFGAL